ncbi:MAG TPA: AAA family ATPase [Armatimonadota bacterium]|jgi:pilus assembly protein CpaE
MSNEFASPSHIWPTTEPKLERRRIVIAQHDPRARENSRHLLFEMGMEIAGLAGDGQEAAQMAGLLAPDFVLLDDTLPVLGPLETAHAIHTFAPNVACIVMSGGDNPTFLRDAMRYRVTDIIAKPLDPHELRESLARLMEIGKAEESPTVRALLDPSKLPRVICITGGKGGVGKTMVATNLALALRARKEKVLLVDLYTQFGDVAATLNMKPERILAELSSMVDDIDSSLIASYVQKHPSGLHVLFSSIDPLPLDSLTVACLDRLLGVVKSEYKYIVFDTPPYLHATTLHALALANDVLLVCNLFDYTTIADTKQLYDTLDGAYVSSDRLKILANRVAGSNKFKIEDVEHAFGHEVFAQIPNDPRVVDLLNTGYPEHMTNASTPMELAMGALCEALLDPSKAHHVPVSAPPPPADRGSSLVKGWKRLIGSGQGTADGKRPGL